jgi:hypothetical protein
MCPELTEVPPPRLNSVHEAMREVMAELWLVEPQS